MAFQIRSLSGGTAIEITLSGVVTGSEVLEASQSIYDVVPLQLQEYQVWDYSKVTKFHVDNAEVRKIANIDVAMARKRSCPLYIISVQPSDLGYGLGRMYSVHAENPNWISMHFRSRDEADDWIKKNIKKNIA